MKIQRKLGKKAEGEISQLVKAGSWKSEGTGNRKGQKQTGNWIFYQGRDWQGQRQARSKPGDQSEIQGWQVRRRSNTGQECTRKQDFNPERNSCPLLAAA